jgi:hypothetical protein
MEPGITWYEVLGVLPGAAADEDQAPVRGAGGPAARGDDRGLTARPMPVDGWWWTSRRGRRGGFLVVRR